MTDPILSIAFIEATATDAAEKAVRDDEGATNPHTPGTDAARIWWKTYCRELLRFSKERMRAKQGESA
jgi:hypothetical protein